MYVTFFTFSTSLNTIFTVFLLQHLTRGILKNHFYTSFTLFIGQASYSIVLMHGVKGCQ